MKIFKIQIITLLCIGASFSLVSAASIVIDSPDKLSNNRQPFVVEVLLDGEEDVVSGFGGEVSYPEDLFELSSIMTDGSVVSFWVDDPHMSDEKYLDGRKHIQFEGIFPGGFGGVRSAYYDGSKSGLLFSIILIPKNKGKGTLVVDDIKIHSFNANADLLPSSLVIKNIEVPELSPKVTLRKSETRRVENTTLNAFVTRNELINRNAWYLIINETQSLSSIQEIHVAESDNYNPETLREREWRVASSPHVLLYQDRTKYIHVKVTYSDSTYSTRTLPPVENSRSISTLSRILISVLALFALALFYGKILLLNIKRKM